MSPTANRNETQLQLRLPAQPEAVAVVRKCVSDFVRGLGFADADEIVVAACQMSANAVLHAYPEHRDDSEFEVNAEFEHGCLRLEVTEYDAGEARGLGLGLRLVERAADDVSVSRRPEGGTRVEARFDRAA